MICASHGGLNVAKPTQAMVNSVAKEVYAAMAFIFDSDEDGDGEVAPPWRDSSKNEAHEECRRIARIIISKMQSVT